MMNLSDRAKANKDYFIRLLRENVKREGIEVLISWLSEETDFFEAPASTRFHGAEEGGLCQHSLNVYYALSTLYPIRAQIYGWCELERESLVIAALLHDICKTDVYRKEKRRVKDSKGVWGDKTVYTFDDPLPFGHGEKSVWLASKFIRLTDDEAFAIRYHMGAFRSEDIRNLSNVYETYPLAFALSVADMEATYYMETRP